MAKTTGDKFNGISSDAVQARTGKSWPEWFQILDAAGARQMTHQEIVAVLATQHGVGPWWQQMVTVGYEQGRGKRVKHQTTGGFQVSRTRTIHATLSELFTVWMDKRKRTRWLRDPGFTIRTATPDRSLRITWIDGQSWLDVGFFDKGAGKSQVAVGHTRLANAADAERMKAYWTEQLDRLKAALEK
jgi:uncharacterized protein YndB with AHSA1/START domain